MNIEIPDFEDVKQFESWWCNDWLPYVEKLETDAFVSMVWSDKFNEALAKWDGRGIQFY